MMDLVQRSGAHGVTSRFVVAGISNSVRSHNSFPCPHVHGAAGAPVTAHRSRGGVRAPGGAAARAHPQTVALRWDEGSAGVVSDVWPMALTLLRPASSE